MRSAALCRLATGDDARPPARCIAAAGGGYMAAASGSTDHGQVTVSAPSYIANFDSASMMALATARFLRGEDFPALGNPPALKPFVRWVNLLPRKIREKLFIASGALETISPRRVDRLPLEEVPRWLSGQYPSGPFPAVAVGSSNGALVHLYAALGIPWLPQTLLIPVRQRVHPDDPTRAMQRGRDPGHRMVQAFPDLQLHHMHDANQDRLMVRTLTYFRVKRRTLGEGYERFLLERLRPGGTILVTDCRQTWRTTRVGERHVFQHGALGGLTEDEFHHGSERVEDYLARYDSPVRRWRGPQPDTVSPEAEWGFEPALLGDITRFAAEHGFRVQVLSFEHPEDPSPMVADLYRWWYAQRGAPDDRLIAWSFVILDPYLTLLTGCVPFWMKFNMEPSAAALERYLDSAGPFGEIYLTLFQHGVESAGLPPRQRWDALLQRAQRKGEALGLDLDEHPLDFPHYAKYDQALRDEVPTRHPIPEPLTLEQVQGFLEQRPGRYALNLWEPSPEHRPVPPPTSPAGGRRPPTSQ